VLLFCKAFIVSVISLTLQNETLVGDL